MGSALFKDLREAKTEADFDALKDRILPEHYYGDIFSCISTPEVLDAYLRHRHLTDNELINAFYTVMRQERIDLLEVFFAGGYLTMQDLLQPDTPSFVVNVTNYVLYKGIVDVMKFFIDKGMPINSDCSLEILHITCEEGKVDILNLLLAAGEDVNRVDEDGNTAAFSAMWSQDPTVLDRLVIHGANLLHKNNDGKSLWSAFPWDLYLEEREHNFQRLAYYGVPLDKREYKEIYDNLWCESDAKGLLRIMRETLIKQGDMIEGEDDE